MALRDNNKNIAYYNKIKEEVQVKEIKKLNAANETIEKIKKLNVEFNKEADEKNQLYGSISKKEIISFLKENNINIHSDDIEMKSAIRELGNHEVTISPYLDISHNLIIKVNKN